MSTWGMLTQEKLDAIRERAAKRTKGKWTDEISYNGTSRRTVYTKSLEEFICECAGKNAELNAEFIAHAPSDIAALLYEVNYLQQYIEQLGKDKAK